MTTLAQISETQAQKATTANENFAAVSVAGIYGRRPAGTSGLTWGYYGGIFPGNYASIADGTLALTANSTNYIEADTATGALSVNAVGWTASGKKRVYSVTTNASGVTAYTDYRTVLDVAAAALAGTNVWTGVNTFDEDVVIGSGSPSATLTCNGPVTINSSLQIAGWVAGPVLFTGVVTFDEDVVIGSGSPTSTLTVNGPTTLNASLTISDTLGVTGATTLSGALGVSGQTLLGYGSPVAIEGTTTELLQVATNDSVKRFNSYLMFSAIGSGPVLAIGASASDTAGTIAYPINGHVLGDFWFVGADESLGAMYRGALMRAAAGSLWSATNRHTILKFYAAASGATSVTNSVNINSVGIDILVGGSTTISTGVGSVKMSTASAATNAAWIPIQYAGTTYYVPGWTTNAP